MIYSTILKERAGARGRTRNFFYDHVPAEVFDGVEKKADSL